MSHSYYSMNLSVGISWHKSREKKHLLEMDAFLCQLNFHSSFRVKGICTGHKHVGARSEAYFILVLEFHRTLRGVLLVFYQFVIAPSLMENRRKMKFLLRDRAAQKKIYFLNI